MAGSGLKLAGWVANHVDPQMAAADDNVRALEERIDAPRIARISFAGHPDYRSIAPFMNIPNPE